MNDSVVLDSVSPRFSRSWVAGRRAGRRRMRRRGRGLWFSAPGQEAQLADLQNPWFAVCSLSARTPTVCLGESQPHSLTGRESLSVSPSPSLSLRRYSMLSGFTACCLMYSMCQRAYYMYIHHSEPSYSAQTPESTPAFSRGRLSAQNPHTVLSRICMKLDIKTVH